MNRSDLERLRDAREHAEHARSLAANRSIEDLSEDKARFQAILFNVIVIGTTFGKISAATKELDPGLRWKDVTDTRNRLVHAYWQIDPRFVVSLLESDVEALIVGLDRMIYLVEAASA